MYIVYDKNQRGPHQSTLLGDSVIEHTSGHRIFDRLDNVLTHEAQEPNPNPYTPTKLVRVSDMKVVSGSKLKKYWCLSYSFSQSGEIIEKGDGTFKRIDKRKHKIIWPRVNGTNTSTDDTASEKRIKERMPTYEKEIAPRWDKQLDDSIPLSKTIPVKPVKRPVRCEELEGRNEPPKVDEWDEPEKPTYHYPFPDVSTINKISKQKKRKTAVSFKRLIQEMCKDLGIDYIWFDQMCINHDDEEEKLKEMENMHRIYENAICTLALIPELEMAENPGNEEFNISRNKDRDSLDIDIVQEVQWSKSVWTLQEAYSSKRVLFLGRNTHFWSHLFDAEASSKLGRFLHDIEYNALKPWNACIALSRARTLTTRRQHEWVFALANMFPDYIKNIRFNYKQSIIDLLMDFYTAVATKDITILLFGAPLESAGKSMITQEQAKFTRCFGETGPFHYGRNK
ncbi:hypothetical protein BJV82DRAFT_657172 [Fennellomyces sp. T-0311]|nr:hypothetical protein BJV82DRAFT_657172 [Fennellomyces sp. T-0311]